MKIIISESQMGNILSKIFGVSSNDSFIDKIKDNLGKELDSVARLILVAIKENKVEKITSDNIGDDVLFKVNRKKFHINNFPVTIVRFPRILTGRAFVHPYKYILLIPFFEIEGSISDKLGQKIWDLLV